MKFLYVITHQTMKMYGSITPHLLTIGINSERSAGLPGQWPLGRGCVGPSALVDGLKKKKSFTLPRIEQRSFGLWLFR
jgi:hypothetical protein